ncbi:MAG: hypothetical protein COA96_04595 [SAR86 cluster bacterium]|uniref:DUF1211 domain-containing protein n=1 Tax=SAR86 cluster bacterium TaxID=2030880 RepID=A0A2A5B5V1_9GAMM|nr:MAG: hypothetical protein COA96_04595 [SAR86 cluster bacterium]
MEPLSDTFLATCRRYQGRILRGENMSRIETFVDAAFAFAFTMLVISIDEVPQSPPELFVLSRDIPAFLLSATLIGSVWMAHAIWSRTFGLQDGVTIYLSLGLVMLVLIFVYPIKLISQATVVHLSDGRLGMEVFDNSGWENTGIADLFLYFSVGFIFLSLLIMALYLNSLRFKKQLRLNIIEIQFCHRMIVSCSAVTVVAISSCIIAMVAEDNIEIAGYVYFLLFILIPVITRNCNRYFTDQVQLN